MAWSEQPLNHILPNFSLSKKVINLLVWLAMAAPWKMEQEKTYAARKLLYEGATAEPSQHTSTLTHTHTQTNTRTPKNQKPKSALTLLSWAKLLLPLKNEALVCQTKRKCHPKNKSCSSRKSNVCNLFKFKDKTGHTQATQTLHANMRHFLARLEEPRSFGPLEY